MTPKEYLRQLERLDNYTKHRFAQLQDLKDKQTAINALDYSKDRVQTSAKPEAAYTRIAEQIAEREQEIESKIESLMVLYAEILTRIENIEPNIYMQVLYKRYVEYKRFDAIADELHYSVRQVLRIHGHALNEFGCKYKDVI